MTFKSLFCDIMEDGGVDKSKVSLGRVAFWITFILCIYMWVANKPVPETLFESFWMLLVYNTVSKVTPSFSAVIDKIIK